MLQSGRGDSSEFNSEACNLMDNPSETLPNLADRRQLDRGSASLRFEYPLESEFREVYQEANLILLRGALAIGFLFGFTVLALDYWSAEPGFNSWSVPVRTGITQVLFLVMLLASFHSSARKSLAQLGTAVGLAVAAIFLLLSAFVEGETVRSAFTGYIVVTFYIYLFMGQRFWPALVTAMALFVSFLVATSLRGQAMDMTIYVTYLMFVNLIGATFLYNHENFHRQGLRGRHSRTGSRAAQLQHSQHAQAQRLRAQ